jgi:hypothetical protein
VESHKYTTPPPPDLSALETAHGNSIPVFSSSNYLCYQFVFDEGSPGADIHTFREYINKEAALESINVAAMIASDYMVGIE